MNPLSQALAAAADAIVQPNTEKRTQPDRRGELTGPWNAFPPAGQRMENRRAADRRRPYFVDRFSPAMLVCVLMLVTASLVDAVLTIRLIEAGGSEINPLMDRLIAQGVLPFLLVKYLLTVAGLPLLLIFKNYRLFGTRFRVGYLIPITVMMYLLLIGYQIALLHQRIEW